MNINELDQAILKIIDLKVQLAAMSYNDKRYDDLEEKLHDTEDAFLNQYGSFLETALHEVHDERCPDNEVLLPIAYLPKQVKESDLGIIVTNSEGVYVDVDDYEDMETRLVLVPRPCRIVLNIGKDKQEIVWKAEA